MVKSAVIDFGGRGAAMIRSLLENDEVEEVFAITGNPGYQLIGSSKVTQVPDLKSNKEIIEFIEKESVSQVIVGPEAQLVNQFIDELYKNGMGDIAFGPRGFQTPLESDKGWTNAFLKDIGVPIPDFVNFKNPNKALDYVDWFYDNYPEENLVVKYCYIAAGKGSIPCNDRNEAKKAVYDIMINKKFGEPADVTIERRLYGEEMSVSVIIDGTGSYVILPFSVDAPRRYSDSKFKLLKKYLPWKNNPNTGGMGAYSPPKNFTENLKNEIIWKIVDPTIRNLPFNYKGVVYFGLMIVNGRPYVLEINVRLGDPEAQVILLRLLKPTFYDIIKYALDERLNEISEIKYSNEHAACVCAVSGHILSFGYERKTKIDFMERSSCDGPWRTNFPGYPHSNHITGQKIYGLDKVDEDCNIYSNGILWQGGYIVGGGRVVTLAAKKKTLEQALATVYENMWKINFNFMDYRWDIGGVFSDEHDFLINRKKYLSPMEINRNMKY